MDDGERTERRARPAAAGQDRQQRLAAALRENLHRRKAQARARSRAADGTPAAPAQDAAPAENDEEAGGR
jgi:hypothetical protein